MAIVYSTWNPSDKGANATLSNGNLTYSVTQGTNGTGRSTVSVSTGKWYWEITITTDTVANSMVATGDGTMSLTDFPGVVDAHGWSYWANTGVKWNNGAPTVYGAAFAQGDIIGVALDAGAGTIQFYKNNVAQGSFSLGGETAPYFAAFGSGAGGAGPTIVNTANFGATTLTYTPPSGYNAGLYTGSSGPANIKSLDGNLIANVKSIDGNLIANVKSFDGNS